MKILVIGQGGREHALVWKIAQSPLVKKVYCAPGNAGTAGVAENVLIPAGDLEGLARFAQEERIDLTCVGPELPLVAGIVDLFREKGLTVFGPTQKAACLEGSKVYAKECMRRYGVPTAAYKVFDDPDAALEYVRGQEGPLVVKADGLAAGKGVTVCTTREEAEKAVTDAMVQKAFGDAGRRIVIEEALEGEEASILALSDGKDVIVLASSQDHKRIFDNDEGPNTGGMGAYSPAPVVTEALQAQILKDVIQPVVSGMEQDGAPYTGVLYAGIMITAAGPKVLEFNVRFGDPETQVILPRMKSDIVPLMLACTQGDLGGKTIEWDTQACVAVVLASGGYPGTYQKGKTIQGLDHFTEKKDRFVFHAGTARDNGTIVTNGGRVLNVVGLGATITEAIAAAYEGCSAVTFDEMQYRRDIGYRALQAQST